MKTTTYILAPTSAPHLQDYFDKFPVEKFTAISFFKFSEFNYSKRQVYQGIPKKSLQSRTVDMSSGDYKPNDCGLEPRKKSRDSYWKDVQAKEKEAQRLVCVLAISAVAQQ